jgi:hypothetical protein
MALCPWGGLPCDCATFPNLKNGIVPQQCEAQMPDELLGRRKVSKEGEARYRAYLAEIEANRNKAAQH